MEQVLFKKKFISISREYKAFCRGWVIINASSRSFATFNPSTSIRKKLFKSDMLDFWSGYYGGW